MTYPSGEVCSTMSREDIILSSGTRIMSGSKIRIFEWPRITPAMNQVTNIRLEIQFDQIGVARDTSAEFHCLLSRQMTTMHTKYFHLIDTAS
jgi:hypothetical protein